MLVDECTDIATIEELSIFVIGYKMHHQHFEHFLKILPLKKANVESIYSVLID